MALSPLGQELYDVCKLFEQCLELESMPDDLRARIKTRLESLVSLYKGLKLPVASQDDRLMWKPSTTFVNRYGAPRKNSRP